MCTIDTAQLPYPPMWHTAATKQHLSSSSPAAYEHLTVAAPAVAVRSCHRWTWLALYLGVAATRVVLTVAGAV